MREIWKDIPGYEGRYQASNLGNIRSLNYHRQRIIKNLKPIIDINNYLKVGLRSNGKAKIFFIHKLILLTFIGDSELQCNHKDGIKENNNLENLEYSTAKENIQHRFKVLGHTAKKGKESHMYGIIGNMTGKKHTEETKQKISDAKKGNTDRRNSGVLLNGMGISEWIKTTGRTEYQFYKLIE